MLLWGTAALIEFGDFRGTQNLRFSSFAAEYFGVQRFVVSVQYIVQHLCNRTAAHKSIHIY